MKSGGWLRRCLAGERQQRRSWLSKRRRRRHLAEERRLWSCWRAAAAESSGGGFLQKGDSGVSLVSGVSAESAALRVAVASAQCRAVRVRRKRSHRAVERGWLCCVRCVIHAAVLCGCVSCAVDYPAVLCVCCDKASYKGACVLPYGCRWGSRFPEGAMAAKGGPLGPLCVSCGAEVTCPALWRDSTDAPNERRLVRSRLCHPVPRRGATRGRGLWLGRRMRLCVDLFRRGLRK